MKILIDIHDDKAYEFMKTIKGLKYIKTTKLTPARALLLKEMIDAVNEINQVKKGRRKVRNAEKFLNEL